MLEILHMYKYVKTIMCGNHQVTGRDEKHHAENLGLITGLCRKMSCKALSRVPETLHAYALSALVYMFN